MHSRAGSSSLRIWGHTVQCYRKLKSKLITFWIVFWPMSFHPLHIPNQTWQRGKWKNIKCWETYLPWSKLSLLCETFVVLLYDLLKLHYIFLYLGISEKKEVWSSLSFCHFYYVSWGKSGFAKFSTIFTVCCVLLIRYSAWTMLKTAVGNEVGDSGQTELNSNSVDYKSV